MSDKISNIKQQLHNVEKQLRIVHSMLEELENENKVDYKSLPGVMGIYDGFYLIAENGEKVEVPGNYAAKSRLVYGDTLKMIEEGDKKLFKQVEKVERRKLDAVVNKKEGKWYALAETGSYRLSDVAVSFNNLNINDKIQILIPDNNLNSPFAALDKVLTPTVKEEVKKVEEPKPQPQQQQAAVSKPAAPSKPVDKPRSSTPRPQADRSERRPSRPRTDTRKPPSPKSDKSENREYVNQISGSGSIVLDDDDLR